MTHHRNNSAYQNVLRWWNNIASYKSEFASLPAGSASAAPAAAAEEDDDDVDLFASDDEVDEEAEKIKVSYTSRSDNSPLFQTFRLKYVFRLNVLLNTMHVKKQRKPRRAKLSPSLTLSSISNHGMMKPISKLWKRVLEVLLWMVSFGVLANSSQSGRSSIQNSSQCSHKPTSNSIILVMVSKNCRSPALLKTIKL